MNNNLLEIKGLTVEIRNKAHGQALVNGVNLSITKNTICALVGNSGSGKSLIASSIMGILAENLTASGEIRFKGKNLLSLTEKQLAAIRGSQIGIVMQNCAGSLNPLMKNGRHLSLIIRAHGASKKDAGDIAVNALEKVCLQNPRQIMSEYPHQLSGGMKQRLLTAMGICSSPEFIIMDEPTKGLDLVLRSRITEMIRRLHKETGITVLLITHDMDMAHNLSDYCYVMRKGEITSHGETQSLFDASADHTLSGLLAAEQKMSAFFWGEKEWRQSDA